MHEILISLLIASVKEELLLFFEWHHYEKSTQTEKFVMELSMKIKKYHSLKENEDGYKLLAKK